MKTIKRILKIFFPGVSWQHPLINAVFKLIDPIDYLARLFLGLQDQPPYSIRVRSNGVNGQFGGKNFQRFGQLIARLLREHAKLQPESKVMEIGCGCGRTAIALSDVLENGNFIGVDIEPVSLQSCQKNKLLQKKEFIFELLNVQNDEYNQQGAQDASAYKFKNPSNSIDIIFLISVFTHMKTADVSNYLAEIARMLKPGGVCMFSTILMDKGRSFASLSFPYKEQSHYYYHKDIPEICIAYELDFFVQEFSKHGVSLVREPLWGSWRNIPAVHSLTGFSQDILFFKKSE